MIFGRNENTHGRWASGSRPQYHTPNALSKHSPGSDYAHNHVGPKKTSYSQPRVPLLRAHLGSMKLLEGQLSRPMKSTASLYTILHFRCPQHNCRPQRDPAWPKKPNCRTRPKKTQRTAHTAILKIAEAEKTTTREAYQPPSPSLAQVAVHEGRLGNSRIHFRSASVRAAAIPTPVIRRAAGIGPGKSLARLPVNTPGKRWTLFGSTAAVPKSREKSGRKPSVWEGGIKEERQSDRPRAAYTETPKLGQHEAAAKAPARRAPTGHRKGSEAICGRCRR